MGKEEKASKTRQDGASRHTWDTQRFAVVCLSYQTCAPWLHKHICVRESNGWPTLQYLRYSPRGDSAPLGHLHDATFAQLARPLLGRKGVADGRTTMYRVQLPPIGLCSMQATIAFAPYKLRTYLTLSCVTWCPQVSFIAVGISSFRGVLQFLGWGWFLGLEP